MALSKRFDFTLICLTNFVAVPFGRTSRRAGSSHRSRTSRRPPSRLNRPRPRSRWRSRIPPSPRRRRNRWRGYGRSPGRRCASVRPSSRTRTRSARTHRAVPARHHRRTRSRSGRCRRFRPTARNVIPCRRLSHPHHHHQQQQRVPNHRKGLPAVRRRCRPPVPPSQPNRSAPSRRRPRPRRRSGSRSVQPRPARRRTPAVRWRHPRTAASPRARAAIWAAGSRVGGNAPFTEASPQGCFAANRCFATGVAFDLPATVLH